MKSTTSLALLAAVFLVPQIPFAGPQAGGGQEAQEQEGQAVRELPVFVRAPIGARASLFDMEGQVLGTVKDHVIDRESGQISLYAVEVTRAGELSRTVSVPIERFTWDAAEKQIRLSATRAELFALAEFDVDKVLGRAHAREAGMEKEELPKYLLTSELVGASVTAGESAVGKLEGLLIEPKHWKIAFALVSRRAAAGEAPLLVPWPAMKWVALPTGEDRVEEAVASFALSVAIERLEAAPLLQRGDPRTLDAEALERISAFWGVKIETRTDDQERED